MIIGIDFLSKVGIDICYSKGVVEWYSNTIPLWEATIMQNMFAFNEIIDSFFTSEEEDDLWDKECINTFATAKS